MSGAAEVTVVARYQVRPGHGDEVARLLDERAVGIYRPVPAAEDPGLSG
jgi:hypothetical protein